MSKTHYLYDEYDDKKVGNETSWESLSSFTGRRSCPTCQSKESLSLHRQVLVLPKDHPFGNEYHAVICKRCSTLFADTDMTEESLAEYYESLAKYQDKVVGTGGSVNPIEQIRYQGIADTIESVHLSKDLKILDIGCANGGLLKVLNARGYNHLFGLDPSPLCVENAKDSLSVDVQAGTIDNVGVFKQKFDLIILSHVCEHLLTPREALTKLHGFLADGGMVYVEVPDPEKFYKYETTPFQEFNTEHINHFCLKSLSALLGVSGFSEVIAGTKNIQTTSSVFYPVVFGIWKKNDQKREFVFDESFVKSILRYREICSWKLRQIDEFLRLKLPKKYAIWGAGQFCYKILTLDSLSHHPPMQIVDGNSTNWGREICGLVVQSPEQLKGDIEAVLVANMISPSAIVNRLKDIKPDTMAVSLVEY